MKVINNAKEFKDFYYYKSPPNPEPCPKPSEYPKRYPCIVEQVEEGGGIMGEYVRHVITYFPKGVNKKAFLLGFQAGKK